MTKSINFKKMLVAFTLLVATTSVSFNVIACKKSAQLSEKEQALKALSELPRTGDWTDDWISKWFTAWSNYFNSLKYEIRTEIFEFTNEQLQDNSLLQAAILKTVQINITADLQKWNIPKEYNSDSVVTKYNLFQVNRVQLEITTFGTISLDLIAPTGDTYSYTGTFDMLFRYRIIT